MAQIAEAFVQIRPDLTDFAKSLRQGLSRELANFKPPPIKLQATIDKASLVAIRRELAANPFTIRINLALAPGTVTQLQREIRAAAATFKPVPVSIAPTRRVLTPTAAAAAPSQAPIQQAVQAAATGTAARAAATTELEKSEARLLALQRQVQAATSESAKRTFDLDRAELQLEQANIAVATSARLFRTEQEKGNVETAKAIALLREQAREAQTVAQTRVGVLAARAQGGTAATPGADLKAVTAAEAAATRELDAALELQAAAAGTSNKALQAQADTLVRVRQENLAAAVAVKEKTQADITANAIQEKSAASAASAAEAASAAAIAIRNADALRVSAPGAGVNEDTELAAAKRRVAASERAVTEAQKATTIALASENKQLIAQANAAEVAASKMALLQKESLNLARTNAQLLPAQNAISRLQTEIDKARSPIGTTETERFKRAAESAAAAGRDLAVVQKAIVAGDLQVGEAEIVKINALAKEIAVLEAATAANYAKAKSDTVSATTASQATRGALGTSAGFLGLRGAILSSSGPFLAATIAVTGFAKVIGQASQLQQSLNVFQATTKATNEQMLEVSKTVKQLGADLSLPSTSANDAATAITELAKAGLSVNDSIDAARGTLQLAAAATLSAGDAAKIAATELNAFGLSGDQAERVTNLLAAASINAQGEISDFAAAFQQASAQAKQSGLSIEQTTTLLTELARAGIRGSDAGTSLRVELLRLVPGTKPAQEAFNKLGIEIDKTATIGAQLPSIIDQFTTSLAKLPTQEQTAVLRDIFGQDASRAAIINLTQGAAAFEKQQAALSATGQAASLTEARAKGLSGAVAGLGSQTQNVATTLGTDLLPALTAIVQALSDVTGAVDSLLTTLDPAVKLVGDLATGFGVLGGETVAKIGLVIAAAVGLNKAIGAIAGKRAADTTAATESATIQINENNEIVISLEKVVAAQKAVVGGYAAEAIASKESAAVQIAANEGVTVANVAGLNRIQRLLKGSLRGRKGLGVGGVGIGIAATLAGDSIGGTGGGILSSAGQGATLGTLIEPGIGTAIGAGVFAAFSSINAINAKTDREGDKVKAAWNGMTFLQQQNYKVTNPRKYAFLRQVLGIHDKPNPFQGTIFAPSAPAALAPLKPGALPAGPFANLLPGTSTDVTVPGQEPNIPLGPAAKNAIAIAQATANNDTKALLAALKVKLDADTTAIDNLNLALEVGFGKNKAARDKAVKNLQSRLQDKKATQDQINQILTDSFSAAQNPAIATIDLNAIKAQGTKTLTDDLAFQKARVAVYEGLLAHTTATGATLKEMQGKLAAAQNDVTKTTQAIADAAKAEAEKQAQAQQLALERAAAASDNQGAPEKELLAFLQKRVAQAKGDALAVEQATNALTTEQDKMKAAIASSAQLTLDLRGSVLDTREAAANLTDTTADNLKVDLARKSLLQAEIDKAQAAVREADRGTDAWKNAKIQVEKLKQQKIAVDADIKNLQGGGSGFTLQELFQESVNQLTTFGSNVTQGSVVTGGAARAAVAGGILAQRPGVQDKLSQIGNDQLTVAKQGNKTLVDILTTLQQAGTGKKGTTVDDQGAGATKASRARRLGQISNAVGVH